MKIAQSMPGQIMNNLDILLATNKRYAFLGVQWNYAEKTLGEYRKYAVANSKIYKL